MSGDREKKIRKKAWGFATRLAPSLAVRRFNYSCKPIEVDGPCLIVANHVTNYDPFFLGWAHKNGPLTFVASEHIFRLGAVSKLLIRYFAPIARSKASSGVSTVKNSLKRLREGEQVALFAEGDCTWDGVTHGVFPATGKLAKLAGVPLVTFRLEGGYLSFPRWAKKLRRGVMRGAPVRIYSPDELKKMAPEDITAAIDRDIFENAWERQRAERVRFGKKGCAEGLERGFFICPECGGISTLKTAGGSVSCSCGFCAELDEYGFFKGSRPFPTLAEWDEFQQIRLREILSGPAKAEDGSAPLRGKLLKISDSGGSGRAKPCTLELKLGERGMKLGGKLIRFDEIENMSMVKAVRLLFTCADGYYEFKCKKGSLRKFLLSWQAAAVPNKEGI